jgi:transposase
MTEQAFKNGLEQAKETIMTVAMGNVPSSLDKNGKAYFEFITTPGVEPTNNVAEQAIRFVVIDRMITRGTRSIKGRETNERLWTAIATCRLQERSAYNFISEAVNAYFHNHAPPSLLSSFI